METGLCEAGEYVGTGEVEDGIGAGAWVGSWAEGAGWAAGSSMSAAPRTPEVTTMVPLKPVESTAESRKCSRSTPEMKKRSASDRALDWAVVMSCSCAEALGASRQVSLRWDLALAASASKCLVSPAAPARS